MSVPKLTEVIIAAVNAVLNGEPFNAEAYAGFNRESGLVALFSFALASGFIWFWMAVKERRRFATLGFTAPRRLRPSSSGSGIRPPGSIWTGSA